MFFSFFRRRIETMLCQSKKTLPATYLNVSKEVTVTPIVDTENNMSLLKKLPDITFDVVSPKPVFKVPQSPQLNTKRTPKQATKNGFNSKVINEKRVSFKKQGNNNINTNVNAINNIEKLSKLHINSKAKPKQKHNNVSLTPSKIILKNPKIISINNLISEKENIQRTSSPNRISKEQPNISKINFKLKNTKLVEKIPNIPITSCEVKNNSNNDSTVLTINNNEIKTNEEYKLMDISTEGKINVVPASCPSYLNNVSIPEYDRFVLGINKVPEHSNVQFETSQNCGEKELIGQEIINLSGLLNYENTALHTNKFNNITFNSVSQSCFVEEKNCDYLIENISKNNSIGCIEPIEKILSNSDGSSDFKLDENTNGVKRGQPQNEPYKKQKVNDTD